MRFMLPLFSNLIHDLGKLKHKKRSSLNVGKGGLRSYSLQASGEESIAAACRGGPRAKETAYWLNLKSGAAFERSKIDHGHLTPPVKERWLPVRERWRQVQALQ